MCAAVLDGYRGGTKGQQTGRHDLRAPYGQFDTILIAQQPFDAMTRVGDDELSNIKTYVFFRTWPEDRSAVSIVSAH